MRFYANFGEALNELKRELKEMGIRVHQKSFQNVNVENDPDYETLELQNYTYTVTGPSLSDIPLSNAAWCEAEFAERVSGKARNPGQAWKLRRELWEKFFSKFGGGKFDYTYSERMSLGLFAVRRALRQDLLTRRAFLPIFNSNDDQDDFDCRIPCSLGYWFYYRQNALHMTYLQRSADFSEHFNNDIWLAFSLQKWMANELEVETGVFSHWLGSLHVFEKDVSEVF